MPILIPTASRVKLLEFALGYSAPGNQELGLYVNDVTPAAADVLATYTEMSTHGYASKVLTKSSWAIAASGGVGDGAYAQQTWTFSAAAAVTVYGYFVKDTSSGLLLWAERFAAAKVIQYAGDQIMITPKLSLS